ncbi:MAG: hypothetical protein HKUEN02_18430 [Anaerolineaceae bacterium]|nr:MAG: hypothetical protein HKUEN02_18430 [Anaerolineaceae bacterium]
MKDQGPRFSHSDAWIFLSLDESGDPTSLDYLIAKADWINHCIPDDDEVEDAINHLAQAGLVRVRGSKPYLTDAGKKLYKTIHGAKRIQALTLWDKLSKHLQIADFPRLKVKKYKLKPNELNEAYELYHQRFLKLSKEKEIQ